MLSMSMHIEVEHMARARKRKESKGKKQGRFSLYRKQQWKVTAKIDNWPHKMNIMKLYKITKTTSLSYPVAKRDGDCSDFQAFIDSIRLVIGELS